MIFDDLSTGRAEFGEGRGSSTVGDIADGALLDRVLAEHPDIDSRDPLRGADRRSGVRSRPARLLRRQRGQDDRRCCGACVDAGIGARRSSARLPRSTARTTAGRSSEEHPLRRRAPTRRRRRWSSRSLTTRPRPGDFRAIALRYFNPIGADPQAAHRPAASLALARPRPDHVCAARTGEAFTITGTDWATATAPDCGTSSTSGISPSHTSRRCSASTTSHRARAVPGDQPRRGNRDDRASSSSPPSSGSPVQAVARPTARAGRAMSGRCLCDRRPSRPGARLACRADPSMTASAMRSPGLITFDPGLTADDQARAERPLTSAGVRESTCGSTGPPPPSMRSRHERDCPARTAHKTSRSQPEAAQREALEHRVDQQRHQHERRPGVDDRATLARIEPRAHQGDAGHRGEQHESDPPELQEHVEVRVQPGRVARPSV